MQQNQAMLVFAGGLVPGATTIPINTWTYITIKADGSSLKVYVNGVQLTDSQYSFNNLCVCGVIFKFLSLFI